MTGGLRMSKYDPLTKHLKAQRADRVPMTFAELEKVLGFPLPPSSRKHRAWWANDPQGHVNARAWRAAGYQSADVDLDALKLVFVKLNAVEPEKGQFVKSLEGDLVRFDHPLWGALAGIVTVMPGVDLTEPADPDWGLGVYSSFDAFENPAKDG
jgi:hypothetical protein